MMLNEMGMKYLLKNLLKMVLLLTPQHNVHRMHIIQTLLIMILLVFEEKGAKSDLLIILRESCEILLHQHKTQHNLIGYEIIYTMHGFIHVPQLNLILFKGNVNYDLKVLTMNEMVRSLHIIT